MGVVRNRQNSTSPRQKGREENLLVLFLHLTLTPTAERRSFPSGIFIRFLTSPLLSSPLFPSSSPVHSSPGTLTSAIGEQIPITEAMTVPSSTKEENAEDQSGAPELPSCRSSPSRKARQEIDAASESSSVHSSEASERRDIDILAQVLSTRSEEYRLLFRLPADEVLVQDFNCALQENFLLQGHMYLFLHHFCFYSNIFGFENKRIIPFYKITDVRKAKTAGIFPNAIEIVADNKKHFFGSFLSRDEAYRLIVDSWLQHCSDAKAFLDSQESKSDNNGQDKAVLILENVKVSEQQTNGFCANSSLPNSEGRETGESDATSSASVQSLTWHIEDVDAPKVPEYFARVAEAKFPISVVDFFNIFFSDSAADFLERFHKVCGDKDLQCTRWHCNEEFRYVRNVSFQHPIKIYFGAKFGSCQEIHKFRVYRNSHLIIETSQQINDVPYGDYFHVQGLWDVEGVNGETACILRVYVNVAFSRKTMWKGKIEQSTREEYHDVSGIWIDKAHELLKQKNLEKQEGASKNAKDIIQDHGTGLKSLSKLEGPSEVIHIAKSHTVTPEVLPPKETSILDDHGFATSIFTYFRELWSSLCSHLKQAHIPPLWFIAFVSILILMQLSIIVMLTRTPEVHLISQGSYESGLLSDRSENLDWLEKRVYRLSEEMQIMETRMESMRREYALLKAHLQSLQRLKPKS